MEISHENLSKKSKKTWFFILKKYIDLCKIRITRTVLFTTALGYYLAHLHKNAEIAYDHFFLILLSMGLICAGACVGNHILESESDAKMSRTKNRPIPNGDITKTKASLWGIFLVICGVFIMAKYISLTQAIYTFLLIPIFYNFIYTPLKKKTPWNTTIGAIPGAWPIACGWICGHGNNLITAWILFFILFFWQHPHFYAIAWMYRNDYEKAGYKMISLHDLNGKRTFLASICTALVLILLTMSLTITVKLKEIYIIISLGIGAWFVWEIVRTSKNATNRATRRVVLISVLYIALWFVAIWLDHLYANWYHSL